MLKNNKTGEILFKRYSSSHWWVNGFKPGKTIQRSKLRLQGSITFKTTKMARLFKNYADRNLRVDCNGRKGSFKW